MMGAFWRQSRRIKRAWWGGKNPHPVMPQRATAARTGSSAREGVAYAADTDRLARAIAIDGKAMRIARRAPILSLITPPRKRPTKADTPQQKRTYPMSLPSISTTAARLLGNERAGE